ncbi:MAG: ribonuclease R [Paludibacteraceae bacterium]|nr:ribonuclease R [Paludibacteraceae bacterium]
MAKGNFTKEAITRQVLNFFNENSTKPFNYKQVSAALGLKKSVMKERVVDAMFDLEAAGKIQRISAGKYKANMRRQTVTGVLDRESVAKKTYLIPDDGGERVWIAERSMGCALNGDRVEVVLFPRRKGKEQEGEVVEVLERKKTEFVGILEVKPTFAFLNIDKKLLTHDMFIPLDKLNGGKDGQRCVGRIVEWVSKEKNPIGEIVTVLGDVGNNDAEMHAILAEFGLPYTYPQEVEDAANEISDKIDDEEIARRVDMRDVVTFTIDPRDAKDFDDALSIRKINKPLCSDCGRSDRASLQTGEQYLWEIGVHIADVTHYVTPDSIIDKEAYKRATSVYLVDRTVPMLPERLCNNICSLRPNEDKLAYSVIFHIDEFAEVKDYKICRTVINSNRRFTYEEAQQIIETGEGDYAQEVLKLNELAQILRTKRFAKGAIAFDRVEVRFEIDEKGKPLSVYFKEAKESNMLIEEFMLLANKTVAAHIGKPKAVKGAKSKAKTFVYRVHDVPNPDKLENFSAFIKRFGYKLKTTGKSEVVSAAINNLLDQVTGKREQNLIETLAIRSMAKATYTTENIGHYGLAFDYYTHFTSPIRRYPDMMVHRLLTRYLFEEGHSVNKNEYEEYCEHSSDMEQLAASAERASIKYKQVEYMSERLGQVYDGVISGVTDWGIYVELNENKCEGMIPVRCLDDDYYEFDEKNYCIVGRYTGKRYQLGDELTVKIAKADLVKKQLDFVLV